MGYGKPVHPHCKVQPRMITTFDNVTLPYALHGLVVVEAPVHGLRIKSDGKRFEVELSNMFRGRTCGLCGDMNGEKVAEMKDPKGCVRTNPEVFCMTYAQTQCRSEMSIPECIREVSRPVHHQQMEFPSMVRESGPLKYHPHPRRDGLPLRLSWTRRHRAHLSCRQGNHQRDVRQARRLLRVALRPRGLPAHPGPLNRSACYLLPNETPSTTTDLNCE